MTDRKGDSERQPPECGRKGKHIGGRCPHFKETGGGFDGARYDCEVCGEHCFLDYDEMR